MTVQPNMAIMPFQGITQPSYSFEYKVINNLDEDEPRQNNTALTEHDSVENRYNVYGRFGKESRPDSLGTNIDMYI
jgi:hypothetical protein